MSFIKVLDNVEMTEGEKSQSIIVISSDCIIKGFTPDAAERTRMIFGKEIEPGESIFDFLGPEEKSKLKKHIDFVLQGNTLKDVIQCCSIDNEDYWLDLYFSPVYGGMGKVTSICISVYSMNKIISNDFRTRHLNEKFRELFYDRADLLFVTHLKNDGKPGPIIDVNETACRVLGYPKEELISKNLSELGEYIELESMKYAARHLLNGETVVFEMFLYKKNGGRIYVDISARIFEFSHEKFVLTIARDITKLKLIEQKLIRKNNQLTKALEKLEQAKEQLVYNEKLACIGQLAAGVAHEINNPLGFICSNIESSRMNFEDFKGILNAYRNFAVKVTDLPVSELKEELYRLAVLESKKDLDFMLQDQQDMFNDIDDGLKRIGEIITGLRAFSRQGRENEFDEYDLNKGIQNSLLIARNDIKYHAEVSLDLGKIPVIHAMSSKVDQVLLNIILNASCAIRDKKTGEPGLIRIKTDIEGSFVRCRIEDNGTGIDKKYIGKVFDPFFTTKPPGQGTGLGLSIAYDIVVNQHGGQMFVESTPMVGSVFTILLPVDRGVPKAGELH